MGKASKWFRGLLGLTKPDPNPTSSSQNPPVKKKWSFGKSHKEKNRKKSQHGVVSGNDATASVASGGKNGPTAAGSGVGDLDPAACVSQSGARYGMRVECAAVMIQSHFRGYLSRRALRALKGLVKLQALVRGHLLRKQTAHILRQMQAIVRAQARARAGRVLISEATHSSIKSSHFNYTAPTTPEKFEHFNRARSTKHEQLVMLKRNNSRSNNKTSERSWEQDKILEVDTWRPHVPPKRKSLFHSHSHSSHLSATSDQQHSQSFSTSTKDSTAHNPTFPSPSPNEAQSFLSPLKKNYVDEAVFLTAENSPQYYSASSLEGSSKKGAYTPTRSDGSRSCLSGYSDHPNYMAFTESSKAKVRSVSAPKQRLSQYERSSSGNNRYSVYGYGESRPNNQRERVSALHVDFAKKAYPGSGRLDRHGLPVRGDNSGFSGGHWLNTY